MRRKPALTLILCGFICIACNESEQNKSESETAEKSETFDGTEGTEKEESKEEDEEYEKEEGGEDGKEGGEGGKEESVEGGKEESGDQLTCTNSDHEGYRTLVHESGSREYILHVPPSYDSENPGSLIINFHGFGGCASDFIGETDYELNDVADQENVIIAYPQAVLREKGAAYWEPGDSGGADILVNDVFFTEQLIADIFNEFQVDTTKVYATGYSNGGMMAYDLSCSGSDFIAAAGIMSGIMLSNACDNSTPTSIIHFHGIADEVIPYDGSGDFPAVLNVIDFWVEHNGIDESNLVSTQLNNGDVVRDEYTGGAQESSVVLYTIHNENGMEGGHVWFSGDIDGVSPSQLMWDFLSAYQLDE